MFKRQLRIDLAEIVTEIELAVQEKDPALASRPTHTLKGLAGTYGMKELSDLAYETHELIKSGSQDQAQPKTDETLKLARAYLDQLDDLFERIKRAA